MAERGPEEQRRKGQGQGPDPRPSSSRAHRPVGRRRHRGRCFGFLFIVVVYACKKRNALRVVNGHSILPGIRRCWIGLLGEPTADGSGHRSVVSGVSNGGQASQGVFGILAQREHFATMETWKGLLGERYGWSWRCRHAFGHRTPETSRLVPSAGPWNAISVTCSHRSAVPVPPLTLPSVGNGVEPTTRYALVPKYVLSPRRLI